jgi:hypothetical protein
MVRDAGLALLLLVGGGGNGAGALNMVNNEARDLMNDATSALQNYWWVAGWFLTFLLLLAAAGVYVWKNPYPSLPKCRCRRCCVEFI